MIAVALIKPAGYDENIRRKKREMNEKEKDELIFLFFSYIFRQYTIFTLLYNRRHESKYTFARTHLTF
jgi:hypothetical protein